MTQRVRPDAADGGWFTETQRFGWPVWMLLLPIALLFWSLAAVQLIGDRPVGSDPAPDWVVLVFWLLFGAGLPALFLAIRMETRVGPPGVHLRHFPFHRKFLRWPFEEIGSAAARTYRPLLEYGGWGIRMGAHGWAYNVKGDRGVQLELRSGRRILIGSQESDALAAAIAKGRST